MAKAKKRAKYITIFCNYSNINIFNFGDVNNGMSNIWTRFDIPSVTHK